MTATGNNQRRQDYVALERQQRMGGAVQRDFDRSWDAIRKLQQEKSSLETEVARLRAIVEP